MVRHTLKILQHLLQDFKSVSDRFSTLRIKGLNLFEELYVIFMILPYQIKRQGRYRRFTFVENIVTHMLNNKGALIKVCALYFLYFTKREQFKNYETHYSFYLKALFILTVRVMTS